MSREPLNAFRVGRDLLGPLLYEFCCKLHAAATACEDRHGAMLFMARGGLRLLHLYQCFLNANALSAPMPCFRFWISRFSAAKSVFAPDREAALAVFSREFSSGSVQDAAAALLTHVAADERMRLLSALPPEIAGRKADRDALDNLLTANGTCSEAIRRHLAEQHRLFTRYLERSFGAFSQLYTVDTGWYGSTLAMLRHFDAARWHGWLLGRWDYRLTQPSPEFAESIGLLVDARGFIPKSPYDVLTEYHHLIEAPLEPNLPSVEYYFENASGDILCNSAPGSSRAEAIAEESDAHWHGMLCYFASAHGSSLAQAKTASHAALKILKNKIRYPDPRDVEALRVLPRSADFGRAQKTPVIGFGPAASRREYQERLALCLWVPGEIAESRIGFRRFRQVAFQCGKRLSGTGRV